jgi:site-specific recombinase XerD
VLSQRSVSPFWEQVDWTDKTALMPTFLVLKCALDGVRIWLAEKSKNNLRHTFASRMTAAGVSPITIARMLGHGSTQIVPRYAQVLDQNVLDAMELRRASN